MTPTGNGMPAPSESATTPLTGESLSLKSLAILLLFGFSILFFHLGNCRTLTLHEVLFAEPAREMIATGNWVLTNFGGVASNHKPPLTHWLIAVSMLVFQSSSEWVVRLSAVMAGMATGLLIAHLACRWHGQKIGLMAGLIQLSTFYTLMQARLAEADMLLAACVAGAMVVFADGVFSTPEGQTDRKRSLAFYLLAGLSFLVKGPLGPAFIFGGAGLFLLLQRDRKTFSFLVDPVGWILFLATIVAWPLTAYLVQPDILNDWRMHHLDRFAGKLEGGEKFPLFYVAMAPLIMLPWTPCVAFGLWFGYKDGCFRDPRWRFLACWFVAGFALLSSAVWQHKHYLIPIMTPLALIGGYGMHVMSYRSAALRMNRPVLTTVSIALFSSLVGVFLLKTTRQSSIAGIVAVLTGGMLVIEFLNHRDRWGEYTRHALQLGIVFGIAWGAAAIAFVGLLPGHDSYRDQTAFARDANDAVPTDRPLYMVELPENQLAFYLRWPFTRIDDVEKLPAELQARISTSLAAGPVYVVAPVSARPAFEAIGSVQTIVQCRTLRRAMTEADRITLFRLDPNPDQLAALVQSTAK